MSKWYRRLIQERRASSDLRPGGVAPPPATPRQPSWPAALVVFLAVLLVVWLGSGRNPGTSYTYSELTAKVQAGEVTSVRIDGNGHVTGKLTAGDSFSSQLPTALGPLPLEEQLRAHDVQITGVPAPTGGWLTLVGALLPVLLLVGFFVWLGRRAQRSAAGGLGGITGVGRSRPKVTDVQRPSTRFTDVAGYEGVKQEVTEVVDVLRRPDRYREAGAKAPRGVLMIGPPGTGKTQIGRAHV